MFEPNKHGELLARLQITLIRSWLAQVEKNLPGFLPAKRPSCIVGIENKSLRGLVLIHPYNQRGTCLALTLPEIFEGSNYLSKSKITKRLLKSAIHHKDYRAQSWIIRCPAVDLDLISITRELGFQPLKLFKSWKKNTIKTNTSQISSSVELSQELNYQRLNRFNNRLFWQLMKSSESSNLRQILDRKSSDIFGSNKNISGVLISKNKTEETAIAGLLSRPECQSDLVLELIRDTAWDERLSESIPIILDKTNQSFKQISIETASEDEELTELLTKNEWVQTTESLLLGRSLWKRQVNSQIIPGTRSLETMLERLHQPQVPPLPSPSLGKR